MGVRRPGRPARGSDNEPDREGSQGPGGRSLTRRQVIAAGAALGGSVVWSPSFSLAGAIGPAQLMASLQRRIGNNARLDESFRARLVGILDNALENFRAGNLPAACRNLANLITVLQANAGQHGLRATK